jgi:hypothetical protein
MNWNLPEDQHLSIADWGVYARRLVERGMTRRMIERWSYRQCGHGLPPLPLPNWDAEQPAWVDHIRVKGGP